jgi:uncharacterized membrane protein
MSVHAPVACILFTPLADAGALLTEKAEFWTLGALTTAGALAFGVIAATLGALDFERGYAKSRRTMVSHVAAMTTALVLSGISLSGRIGEGMSVVAPAPIWAIACGVAALIIMLAGAYFGGDLVYHFGVNVKRDSERGET